MASAIENVKVKIAKSVEIPVLTRCCFCIPLRKGLIAMAYINLALTGLVIPFFAYFMFSYAPDEKRESLELQPDDEEYLLPQLIIEFVALIIEFIMTIVFLVGLHMKKVILMRVNMYFGIVYFLFSTVYNVVLACLSRETISEFAMIVTQLIIYLYFLILVWSSIVKMSRDGSVKYTRTEEV